LAFGNVDRLVFTALYHLAPGMLDALKILKPQTVIRWHPGNHEGAAAGQRQQPVPRNRSPLNQRTTRWL
jgi:hypothetical protein